MGAADQFQRRFGEHGDLVDFAAGSVFGRRWWAYNPHHCADRGPLTGMYAPWAAGENTAACLTKYASARAYLNPGWHTATLSDFEYHVVPGRSHQAPADDCACGFYAFWNDYPQKPIMIQPNPLALHITGIIEGYGRTLLGDYGFRCEKARIVAAQVHGLIPFAGRYQSATIEHIGRRVAQEVHEYYQVPVYDTVAEMLDRHPVSPPPSIIKH